MIRIDSFIFNWNPLPTIQVQVQSNSRERTQYVGWRICDQLY
jgi:hypothetical protein